ncbi:B3/4 domain-containing protein [Mesorhizobium sp. WSM1293]|uniref:B3/B4 domain-containing protein n=1 Tax=Mesorhizobium sp. WSM1293 TaxID=1040984 RepID=UPI0004817C0D|nr:B3/4 domain-containing protein [Mesorhizobium sp. WSM1293]
MLDFPRIDEEIAEIAPDFRAISILVDAQDSARGVMARDVLGEACDFARAGGPAWGEAHLANWAEAYVRFGAKPNRTPCSAHALKKRVEKDGRIPSINPIVDLYNAVSLRFAIPIGGENFDAYVGKPRLTVAVGTESFHTVLNGETVVENPSKGEVIWRDDLGATCRRWNWRQGTRTRLERVGGRMWFILESLAAMPEEALEQAANMLVSGLRELAPGCKVYKQEITPLKPVAASVDRRVG